MRFRRVQLERVERLVVRQKRDGSGGGIQAIAHTNAGMIHELGARVHFAKVKVHLIQFLDLNLSGEIIKRDRKKRRGHLALEDFAQPGVRAVITENGDLILVVVGRQEKRETLNVVPMNVCDQKAEVDRLRSKFFFQGQAECANSGAGIEHNNLAVGAELDTSGVAAIANGGSPRDWN